MLGYVFVYRPETGAGMIVSERGAAFELAGERCTPDLHGGDVVEFQVADDERGFARLPILRGDGVRVVQRGADSLASMQTPLVEELYRTVEMDAGARL